MALAPQTVKHDYINKIGEEEEEEETTEKRSLAEQERQGEETEAGGTPKRYVPLCEVYSATSPCINGGIMSKKVKARKMTTTLKTAATTPLLDQTLTQPHHHLNNEEEDHRHTSSDIKPPPTRPPLIKFYTRRRHPKRPRLSPDSLVGVKEEQEEEVDTSVQQQKKKQKNNSDKKNKGKGRVNTMGLGADLSAQLQVSRLRSHGEKLKNNCISSSRRRKTGGLSGSSQNLDRSQMVNSAAKRWVRLSFDGADSKNFIGLQCKVYWPLDDDWYTGRVVGYNAETGRYHVSYEDGEEEDIIMSNESVKFYISRDEMLRLNLSYKIGTSDLDGLEFSEMVVLAVSFDECQELALGDIIWAKIAGHATWPAVVVNESCLENRKGLNKTSGGKSVPVQFFGTHDFARVNTKQIIPFLKGLLSSFHLKCKKPKFVQSLEEAKMYLNEQKLPRRMIRMQNGMEADDCDSASQEDEQNADSGEDCKMELSNSKPLSKSTLSKVTSQRLQDLPTGYRPVLVKWKDLDKCNVCHMDEEYENNLFLQCDKCRMMVHAKCYGELEPVDGVLWLCNLCRPGAPNFPPPCCLCPLIGGAMKPTTDGRWAHLACAIWIPETCLSDIKKMEPIDGLSRINKDRWKLLCSICGVSYGACIQLEDEDRLHLISMDEDEDEQCIRLLSFCKKHRPPSTERSAKDDRITQAAPQCSDYSPPSNPSGCARSEGGKNLKLLLLHPRSAYS